MSATGYMSTGYRLHESYMSKARPCPPSCDEPYPHCSHTRTRGHSPPPPTAPPHHRLFLHIESGYKKAGNPYHNEIHGADVLRMVHTIITHAGLRGGYIDNLTLMSCYLVVVRGRGGHYDSPSGHYIWLTGVLLLLQAIHDYEHLGLTNDYLINTEHPLALRYNDKSPMENHHAASSFAAFRWAAHA